MTNKKYHLIDVLKICTLISIQVFHTLEFIFFDDNFSMNRTTFLELSVDFARLFSLGGQILVAIIYLLFGLRGKNTTDLLKIAGFAFIGQMILALIFMEDTFLSGVEWDIYGFICVTNLLLMLIPREHRSSWLLIVPSLLVLIVPPTVWHEAFPEGFGYDMLVGRKTHDHTASWALLPWFFHAALFFGIGDWIRKNPTALSRWLKRETLLWPVLFLTALPWIGYYYNTPVGGNFYNFNFNQSSWIFWANFLPFLLILRLSFLDWIQERLQALSGIRWISNLMWCRHMGMAYLLALIYVGIGADYDQNFREHPLVLDVFFIALMPVCEILVRVIYKLLPKGEKAG